MFATSTTMGGSRMSMTSLSREPEMFTTHRGSRVAKSVRLASAWKSRMAWLSAGAESLTSFASKVSSEGAHFLRREQQETRLMKRAGLHYISCVSCSNNLCRSSRSATGTVFQCRNLMLSNRDPTVVRWPIHVFGGEKQ